LFFLFDRLHSVLVTTGLGQLLLFLERSLLFLELVEKRAPIRHFTVYNALFFRDA
jgi:hypothetical protein